MQTEKPEENPLTQADIPVALTIAGSDSGGGAGVQADLLTFAALGVYGTTAITCLTAQNPDRVTRVLPVDPDMVTAQADQVASWFPLRGIKTGMLFNAEIIEKTAAFLARHPEIPAIVDPVMVSTSGALLLEKSAVSALRSELLPRASLITPNLDEVAVLLGKRPDSIEEMENAALALRDEYQTNILVKGGHLCGERLTDLLVTLHRGTRRFSHQRYPGVNTHGSGCTLAAAIAAWLARSVTLGQAVENALAYLHNAMRNPVSLPKGRFISHGALQA